MSLYDTLINELKDFDLGIFDKSEQERRIGICQGCANYSGEDSHRCNLCKCNIGWKVMFTPSGCPEGKWRGK